MVRPARMVLSGAMVLWCCVVVKGQLCLASKREGVGTFLKTRMDLTFGDDRTVSGRSRLYRSRIK